MFQLRDAQTNYDETEFSDDRSRLLRGDDDNATANGDLGDVELALGSRAPPSYVGQSEGLQYQLSRVENKVEKLEEIYKAQMSRPVFDEEDEREGEDEIELLTKDISQVFCF